MSVFLEWGKSLVKGVPLLSTRDQKNNDLVLFFTKKTAADGKRQEIIVLDSKRSNAINIGLTVLPPPRTIKTAILNFDEYALNKEGIEVRKNSQCLQVCIFNTFFPHVAYGTGQTGHGRRRRGRIMSCLSAEICETSVVDSEAGSIMRLGMLSDHGLSALFE